MKKDIHGGNVGAIAEKLDLSEIPDILHDFSVNINPYGMAPDVDRLLSSFSIEKLTNYPEVYAGSAVKNLAEAHEIPEECILVGNGSTEIFSWIVQAVKPGKAHGMAPCYSGYAEVCQALGIDFEFAAFAKKEDEFKIDLKTIDLSDIELIFLGSPNNPTGMTIPRDDIIYVASAHPETFFVIDESFMDFLPNSEGISLCKIPDLPKNIAVVKSLTKFFALAGIRLGMVYADQEIIAKFAEKRLTWSVNAMAQEAGQLLYRNQEYICETRKKVCELRKLLSDSLTFDGQIKVYPGEADFLLCESLGEKVEELQKKLLMEGILIRVYDNMPGLDNSFFRIAVRDQKANRLLADLITGKEPDAEKRRPIMVVGTTSGAGKSVIAAAFCRYFARKGMNVAPFKAQNMSLNSFVTKEGGEMGRAQVVQAQAAGVEPHTDMNPVLLKPTGDAGSQLIVNGKVVGNFGAREYYEKKGHIREDAHAAYDRLADRCDLIVLEGAGSPAEINLMKEDFVNMSMAEYANARTILVADINPGGVFASIYGTIKLLPEKYRKLFCGIIINKFRGDVSLLDSGIEEIEKLTGIPVLGVLPFLSNIDIEEEDSMGLDAKQTIKRDEYLIDIAVVRIPRISNYTDFLALETVSGVSLRYVSDPRKLGQPDLVILPGTKNTISDMIFLKESGFEQKLGNLRSKDVPFIGICGGYQMLGNKITDPLGIEGDLAELDGLGFLKGHTEITEEKELAQVSGKVVSLPFAETGTGFSGYEIHMGVTEPEVNDGSSEVSARGERTSNIEHRTSHIESEDNFKSPNHQITKTPDSPLQITSRRDEECSEMAGMLSEDGLVFGCYVHGFFDKKELRDQLVKWLADKKGTEIVTDEDINQPNPFDRLADMLEENADLSCF